MSTVPTHELGSTGITVPALSLGSWHTWDRAVFEESIDMVRRLRDVGSLWFDVGIYRAGFDTNPYDSPTDIIVGRAIAAAGVRREDYLLSIKGWLGTDHASGDPAQLGVGLKTVCEQTLVRHGTDHADFVVLGGGIRESLYDAEVVVGRVKEVLDAGLAKHWAINNWSIRQITEAQAVARRLGIEPPQYSQVVYSIFHHAIAQGEPVQTLSRARTLTLQASYIFEGGRLLGKGADRYTVGNYDGGHDAITAALPRLHEIAASYGASLPQLALAYPLCDPLVGNALFGARTLDQLDDLIGVFDVIERVGAGTIRAELADFWHDRSRNPLAGGEGPDEG